MLAVLSSPLELIFSISTDGSPKSWDSGSIILSIATLPELLLEVLCFSACRCLLSQICAYFILCLAYGLWHRHDLSLALRLRFYESGLSQQLLDPALLGILYFLVALSVAELVISLGFLCSSLELLLCDLGCIDIFLEACLLIIHTFLDIGIDCSTEPIHHLIQLNVECGRSECEGRHR